MITHARAVPRTELTLLQAMAIRALAEEHPLSCREAAALYKVSLSTMHRAASRAIAGGLARRLPLANNHESHYPRNTRPLTLAGHGLLSLLDLSHPNAEYHLLNAGLQSCSVNAIPYNPLISAQDNLTRLARRASDQRKAVDPTASRAMAIALLMADDPPAVDENPFTQLATHPGLYGDALLPLQAADRRHVVPRLFRESNALIALFNALPALSDRASLLYLRLAPTPRADLFFRPTDSSPFRLSPYGASLSDALTYYLQTNSNTVAPDSAPLRHFFRDFTLFCHPDAVILEGLPATSMPDTLLSFLPPDTTLLTFPREPHTLSLAMRGTVLLTLRELWEQRLTHLSASQRPSHPKASVRHEPLI